ILGGAAAFLLVMLWALAPRPPAQRGRYSAVQFLLGTASLIAVFAGMYLLGWSEEAHVRQWFMHFTWTQIGIFTTVAALWLWLFMRLARPPRPAQRTLNSRPPRRWGWLIVVFVVLAGVVLFGIPVVHDSKSVDPQGPKHGELVITGIEPELTIFLKG